MLYALSIKRGGSSFHVMDFEVHELASSIEYRLPHILGGNIEGPAGLYKK